MSKARLDISSLRQAYARNENITKLLTEQGVFERQEIIELAYDIQSGSYIKSALANDELHQRYAREIHELCKDYIFDDDLILDCGAGELTTLSALSQYFPERARLIACDISLSRLHLGRGFADRFMRGDLASSLELFVADMASMPLLDNSVDVVFTSHSLEPNHGREANLLMELLRIARRHLILFEPSWEHANDAIRARMEELGYVSDLPRYIKEAGGELVSVKPLPHSINPMNPTFCYIVDVSNVVKPQKHSSILFQCPRSGFSLQKRQSYWWSMDGGWAYPVIDNISCLRTKHGVLMSHG